MSSSQRDEFFLMGGTGYSTNFSGLHNDYDISVINNQTQRDGAHVAFRPQR